MSLLKTAAKYDILSSREPFQFSRTALALILATIFLAVILTFSILQHINRSQEMMERFLLERGKTIITAIEAGMRTSMMHFMGGGDPLQTLITESSRENGIVFIRIVNRNGVIKNQTDGAPKVSLSNREVGRLMDSDASSTHIERDKGIIVISRSFHLHNPMSYMPMMGRRMGMMGRDVLSEGVISVGLYTKEFDQARKQDIQHAFFMGAILLLVGSAGLYFLFLYQGIRVANTTLANMKLYTSNVVESIPVGLITLDREERIVSYNRKMEDICGHSLGRNRGEKITSAFPGWQVDCHALRSAAFEQSIEFPTEDGRIIPIKTGGSSLVNNDGKSIGTVLVIRDMTTIKDMEEQLERSRRMAALGKMAAGIAHEIRNPLGTLRGFAHFFGKQPDATRESKDYADLMVSEVDRLNRTISGLLQFARPREPQRVEVDLDQLISKTVALMEGDFVNHELNFHWRCNTGIRLKADPDLLLQVMMNLLKNSIYATPSGGEVSLMGKDDEHSVRITVSDSGCGMTEQEKEKMFDPFFTTKKTGTGLGLAVSHQIIEQHGGTLEVESGPGEGTCVMIILPNPHSS